MPSRTNSPTGAQTSHRLLSEHVEDCCDEIKFYQLIIVTGYTQLRLFILLKNSVFVLHKGLSAEFKLLEVESFSWWNHF